MHTLNSQLADILLSSENSTDKNESTKIAGTIGLVEDRELAIAA